jgi:hypothetical protein
MEISFPLAHDYLSFMISVLKRKFTEIFKHYRYFIGADSAGFKRVRPVAESVHNGDKSVGW